MLKMGVHAPEAFQSPPAGSELLNVGYDNLLVAADQDMGYPASTVDQKADLTADFIRKLGNGLAKFWRDDKSRCGLPTVEIAQAADLVCFESACLSIDLN